MREITTIAKFTFKDLITKKSFIISNIIILLLIVVGFNVPRFLKKSNSSEPVSLKYVVSDPENVYGDSLKSLDKEIIGFEVQVLNDDLETVKKLIQDKQNGIDSVVLVTKKDNQINVNYIVENIGMTTYVPDAITSLLTTLYQQNELLKMNVSEEDIISLYPSINVEMTSVSEEAKGNILIMMFISIALFFAVYYTAFQVSSSITTEKTSKIIETLVVSTKPRNIVIGKTLGIGLAGLLDIIVIGIVVIYSAFTFLDKELLNQLVDVSFITWKLGIITVVYFILGYFVFAFLYALTGSTVSKPEDVQSANGPVAIIALIGFYLAYFTLMNPSGSINKFAALFPFSSPFCEPIRVMMGLSSGAEIFVSILILVLTIALIAYVSIKIYCNAILNYGSKLNFKDLAKMFKQK